MKSIRVRVREEALKKSIENIIIERRRGSSGETVDDREQEKKK